MPGVCGEVRSCGQGRFRGMHCGTWEKGDRTMSQIGLLDYYAGQALQGLMVGMDLDGKTRAGCLPDHELAIKFCFDVAEAMLEERKRRIEKRLEEAKSKYGP